MTELAVRDENTLSSYGARTSATAMELPPDLSYEDYEVVLHLACGANTATTWWIADALRHGERAYKHDIYMQAVHYTGLSEQTLRNYCSVANRVPPSRRVAGLRFSHHQEVAPLEPADQTRWLEQADRNGWTKAELRAEIHAEKDGNDPAVLPPAVLSVEEAARAVWHASVRSVGDIHITPSSVMLELKRALGE